MRVRGGNIWRERGYGIFGESEGMEYLVSVRGGYIWREWGEGIFGESLVRVREGIFDDIGGREYLVRVRGGKCTCLAAVGGENIW